MNPQSNHEFVGDQSLCAQCFLSKEAHTNLTTTQPNNTVPSKKNLEDAVEIFRNSHIGSLKQRILTGAEEVSIANQTKEFIIKTLAHDSDWESKVANTILNIERSIEHLKIQAIQWKSYETSRHAAEIAKLSPEEVEAYKKRAKAGEKISSLVPKAPKAAKAKAPLHPDPIVAKMMASGMSKEDAEEFVASAKQKKEKGHSA